MTAYVIADIEVGDAHAYETYKKLAQEAIAKYGGRYLARGGEVTILEGAWAPSRLVVLEFDSVEQTKRFYDSPEYRAAREARAGIAEMNLLVVEGLPAVS